MAVGSGRPMEAAEQRSPKHYIRKHSFRASFGGEKRGTQKVLIGVDGQPIVAPSDDVCPVHSYSTIQPLKSVRGAASFGTSAREVIEAAREAVCPKHFYCDSQSTLRRTGATAFSKETRQAEEPTCPEAFYSSALSTLSRKDSATFGRYQMAHERGGVPATGRAPVHAYATPQSSLRTRGAVPFGSTAPRAQQLVSLSRTGLLSATPTSLLPTAPVPKRPLPALARAGAASPTSTLDTLHE